MINDPSVEEMVHKLGTEGDPASSYVLCVVAAAVERRPPEE